MADRYRVKQLAGKYIITWPISGGEEMITAYIDRVKSHRDGRITSRVKISAQLINGRAELHQGQLNLVAVRSRRELASALSHRLDRDDINWDAIIEDLCREVTEREEQTTEAEQLQWTTPAEPEFLVRPILLERLSSLWYGPGASGKSLISLYIAMLVQNGLPFLEETVKRVNVLYCDWETDRQEAERRAAYLAPASQIDLPFYRRCILPLVDEASEIAEDMARHDIGLVIIDSAGPACGGDIQSAELAVQYFNALRKICAPTNAASLTLTHVTKMERRDKKQRRLPIGSIYFENYPRITWELRKGEDEETAFNVSFHCGKTNNIKKPSSLGLRIVFDEQKIAILPSEAEDILSEEEGLGQAICDLLAGGPLTPAELASELDTSVGTVRNALTRLKKQQKVINPSRGKWGLLEHDTDHNVIPFLKS